MIKNQAFLPWQIKHWSLLHSYIKLERIPQALLITGPRGLGKQWLANQFAYSLLCEQPKADGIHCGTCSHCLLVKAGSHPDFFEINPEEEKKSISIKQIRAVITGTSLKPQYEKHRVIIINPADSMTISAINAFLKCLEEPGERTIFILITSKPHRVPATMLSRCQQIKLAYPERPELRKQLQIHGVCGDIDDIVNLLKYSILSFNELSDARLLKQCEDSLSDWLSLTKQEKYPSLIAEKWLKIPDTDLFNWLFSWISDLIKCRQDCDSSRLCNLAMAKVFKEVAKQHELPKLYKLYKLILDSRAQLGGQINQQLMLEEILIQWQQLNRSNQRWQKPLPDKG